MVSAPDELAWSDRAPCALMQTHENGTFLRVNRTFCAWVGYEADALVERRRFQDLLTMGGRIFHHTHWNPLLELQGSISEVKLDLLHRDGTTIPMVLNAVRYEQAGAFVHHLAGYVARDRDVYERELIASRKRLESMVAEATRHQAEAKDRALFAEQMMGIVSHDLRNPLSAVSMAAAVLLNGELSQAQRSVATRISRSAERAARLIADLLDFTQVRLGRGLTMSKTAIDLHSVISETVDELRHIYPNRVIDHQRSGEGECFADADRLAQLVGNLVSNAITHGDSSRSVTVSSSIDGSAFAVAVHNEGAPIPSDAQASIFEPMTRGANAPVSGRSVGLGLFIVKEIANAHGGSAQVESNADQGTTFRVILPLN